MQSVVERYYSSHFATHKQIKQLSEDEVLCVHQHHNGLCILVLAEDHPIRKLSLLIDRVDFTVNGVDYTKKNVSGKKKKGGQHLQPHSVFCKVYTKPLPSTKSEGSSPPLKARKTSDRTEWNIYACIKGFLIEPNRSLLQNPSLLESRVCEHLHSNIVQPNISHKARYRRLFWDYHATQEPSKIYHRKPTHKGPI